MRKKIRKQALAAVLTFTMAWTALSGIPVSASGDTEIPETESASTEILDAADAGTANEEADTAVENANDGRNVQSESRPVTTSQDKEAEQRLYDSSRSKLSNKKSQIGNITYPEFLVKNGWHSSYQPYFTFTQRRSTPFSMFDTITDSNGNLIIIDGGYAENCNEIMKLIRSHGNHVSAWILTHYHDDHVQAFFTLLENGMFQGVNIERIYAPDYPEDLLTTFPELRQEETFVLAQNWRKELDGLSQVHLIDEGTNLTLVNGLQMYVYNGWNRGSRLLGDASRRKQLINNAGLMFKLYTSNSSILITADVERIMEAELTGKYGGNMLRADYVQCSHHGICHGLSDQGFSPDFYCNTVKAYMAFIPNRSGMGTVVPLITELRKRGMPVKMADGNTSVTLY